MSCMQNLARAEGVSQFSTLESRTTSGSNKSTAGRVRSDRPTQSARTWHLTRLMPCKLRWVHFTCIHEGGAPGAGANRWLDRPLSSPLSALPSECSGCNVCDGTIFAFDHSPCDVHPLQGGCSVAREMFPTVHAHQLNRRVVNSAGLSHGPQSNVSEGSDGAPNLLQT
jgi:hypothetical protein